MSTPVSPPPRSTTRVRVVKVDARGASTAEDRLVVEEPLEIRLAAGGDERPLAVTMRTPGADRELALGFLWAEGVIAGLDDVAAIDVVDDPWGKRGEPSNVLRVELAASTLPELAALERHFFASSACGVCGRAGIESLRLRGFAPLAAGPVVDTGVLDGLPARLGAAQGIFAATGGLHAAALFGADGELVAVREDVGRHNALDKLVGWALGEGRLPLAGGIVLVSGRSSFEIVQKSLAAGVPVVCSVSAPSSLAVELARRFGLTLVGFLRSGRCNVYAGGERLAPPPRSRRYELAELDDTLT